MNKILTPEEIEVAAMQAIENFGSPELLGIPDSDGNLKIYDMKNLSEKDTNELIKFIEEKK